MAGSPCPVVLMSLMDLRRVEGWGALQGAAGGNEVLEEVGKGCPWVVPLGWGRRIPSMVLLAVLPDASPR